MSIYKVKIIFLCCFLFACTEENDLKLEADAFCEVHNPDNWQAEMSGMERISALAKKIRAVVKSEEIKNIFKEELTMSSTEFREKYDHHSVYYEEKISALLGEKWTCNYLKYHYPRPDNLMQIK